MVYLPFPDFFKSIHDFPPGFQVSFRNSSFILFAYYSFNAILSFFLIFPWILYDFSPKMVYDKW